VKLEHESIPFEVDVVLQRQIELILLNEPGIYDYTVQVGRTSNFADEITIYFIRQSNPVANAYGGFARKIQACISFCAVAKVTPCAG